MRFLKGAAEISVMLIVIAAVSKLSLGLSFLLCILTLILGLIAVIRPLPKLRLPSRPYNFAVAVIVGVLGMVLPILLFTSDEQNLAELRAKDPDAYLAELRDQDKTKWLSQLEILRPAQYEEVKAKEEARKAEAKAQAAAARAEAEAARAEAKAQAEAAREEAKAKAESARQDAVMQKAQRLAASVETRLKDQERKVEDERKAKLERLKIDETNLRKQVTMLYWRDAKDTLAEMKQRDEDAQAIGDEIENTALDIVKALPVSTPADIKANQEGYEFLSALRPQNETYRSKASHYAAKLGHTQQAAVTKLRRTEDKIGGDTFFEHPNQPKYLNSRSTVYLYIGRHGEEGRPWLRMKVQYTASKWLFVNDVYAWHDGVKEKLVSGGFKRDNNSTIWEWVDVNPTRLQVDILKSLAYAKEAVLRFDGRQYHKDVTLSSGDKRALREVLLAYNVMLGED